MRVAATRTADFVAIAAALALALNASISGHPAARSAVSAGISVAFATAAWLLRGVDLSGAVAGAAIAFVFYRRGGWPLFTLLFSVFVITSLATKLAALRKGIPSSPSARNARQIVANLFVPAAIALSSLPASGTLITAAVTELAADTVSSESGEAFGGNTYLVSTWRKLTPGANGGISLAGTSWGVVASFFTAVIAFVLGIRGAMGLAEAAGIMGMFVDSLLGATLENKGWLNNNAVNLLSTASAAAIAWALLRIHWY